MPLTLNQLRANRENAQRSTGPRTLEGKERAAQNSLTHGLHATTRLAMSIEDQQRADALRASLWEQYAPASPIEAVLLDDLIRAAWRLQRLAAIETGYWEIDLRRTLGQTGGLTTEQILHAGPEESENWLAIIAYNDGTRNGPDFQSKLTRQRSAAERSFYRALRAVEEQQQKRSAAPTPKVQNEPNSLQTGEDPRPDDAASIPLHLHE